MGPRKTPKRPLAFSQHIWQSNGVFVWDMLIQYFHIPQGSNHILRRWLDPPNPPQPSSQKVVGALGIEREQQSTYLQVHHLYAMLLRRRWKKMQVKKVLLQTIHVWNSYMKTPVSNDPNVGNKYRFHGRSGN